MSPGQYESPADFAASASELIQRAEAALDAALSGGSQDDRLRQAMHYAVFNGGKRLRPLLVYASGSALGISSENLDAPACAVELIHCYSLVHDDLPAMDDDNLRRGRPTTHLAFDEALAILAGDALQALAFELLANDPIHTGKPAASMAMIRELTRACGADGMAGGQALDLEMEGQQPDRAAVEHMFRLKTGALIRASVMMPAVATELPDDQTDALRNFAEAIGLAFQIRDDLLDIEGQTGVIGKTAGADQAHLKATWPGLFGIDQSRARIDELSQNARDCLSRIDGDTRQLAWLADKLAQRDY